MPSWATRLEADDGTAGTDGCTGGADRRIFPHMAFTMTSSSLVCVLSLLLGDVPSRIVKGPGQRLESKCTADSDCTISTGKGCCDTCCPATPHAVNAKDAAEDCSKRNCGFVPCKTALCRQPVDPSTLHAVCRMGYCTSERLERVPPSLPPSTPPPRDSNYCERDSQCHLSSVTCCPKCCPGDPVAVTQQRLAEQHAECAATMCAMLKCVAPDQCPPVAASTAICRAHRCEVSREAGPPPRAKECETDLECSVIYAPERAAAACAESPCGCCPPQPLGAKRNEGQKSPPAKPPFGLSTGPPCPPCPASRTAVPICRQGRCTLLK